jgi:NAD-specific glutamate dehydrogenase
LTYAQQSRERSNYEQAALNERMQEYKRQIDRESRWSSNGSNGSPNGDGIQAIGRSSHKMIEAVMQSAAKGKVFRVLMPVRELLLRTNFFPCKSSKTRSKLSGSNY